MNLLRRVAPGRAVALETTLLLHGVPRGEALPLHRELAAIVRSNGAEPALVGVVAGKPVVGMSEAELDLLLEARDVPKANTANLGPLMHQGSHAATTVSATMELAAAAGLSFFATGGIGGVHRNYGTHFDVSSDLAALSRWPVAVVASGVKSILDVTATREALESLGITVIGFGTDRFPAFYLRDGGCGVDARFDDAAELARFVRSELSRTGRGILIANPIPAADELSPADWGTWLARASSEAATSGSGDGRSVTPRLLERLHSISGGATLRANLSLAKSNAALAARLAGAA